MKLNEARRLLVCADGINILSKNVICLKVTKDLLFSLRIFF